MTEKDIVTFAGLALMALAYILWGREKVIHAFERRGWISFSAGASVSYAFIHVFPEIGIFQQQITGSSGDQPLSYRTKVQLQFLYARNKNHLEA